MQVFVDFHRFSHIVYEFRNCKKREKSRILPKRSRFLPQNETYSRKVKHAFYPEISDFHEISAVSLGLCMRWERHSRVPNAVFLPHVVPRGTMSQAQSGYRSISTSSYRRFEDPWCPITVCVATEGTSLSCLGPFTGLFTPTYSATDTSPEALRVWAQKAPIRRSTEIARNSADVRRCHVEPSHSPSPRRPSRDDEPSSEWISLDLYIELRKVTGRKLWGYPFGDGFAWQLGSFPSCLGPEGLSRLHTQQLTPPQRRWECELKKAPIRRSTKVPNTEFCWMCWCCHIETSARFLPCVVLSRTMSQAQSRLHSASIPNYRRVTG